MEKRPNILLILSDQQRRDSLGAYGCRYVSTPNLDALAAEGTRYDRAYCNAPVCTPSRASILTGKRICGHGVYNLFDILPQSEKLLPWHLREAGYQTGLVGKLHVSGIVHETRRRNRWDGFDHYELSHDPNVLLDEPLNSYGRWLREKHPGTYEKIRREGRAWKGRPPETHFSTWVSERSAAYIRERDKKRPFFLSVGYFDPHSPYDNHPRGSEDLLHEEFRPPILAPAGEPEGDRVAALDRIRRLQCRDPNNRMTPEETEQLRRGYFAGVSFLDSQLGKIIQALRDEGVYDDTLIIYGSDHGDMLCDHNLLGKGAYFYDACTSVPLIIKYPGQREGAASDRLVQLNDLFATVMTAAGLVSPIPEESLPLQGRVRRELAVCEYRGCGQLDLGIFPKPVQATMVRDGRYKLNLYHDTGETQLFDLQEDPGELRDLARDPARQGTVLRLLRAYLDEKAEEDYRLNVSRGGLSEIPAFSKLKQRLGRP